jgi:hypothetical protein
LRSIHYIRTSGGVVSFKKENNLQDAIRLVIEDMEECGELPSFESKIKKKGVIISSEPLITVTV